MRGEYERAGASALSVLTDEKFFQGRLDYLQMIRTEVKLPLLRKDFIIDELQVYESVAYGADAILLIVAILDAAQLKAFSALAKSLRVAALVEVHDELELDRALAAGAEIIGINNRDLRDFSVELGDDGAVGGNCSFPWKGRQPSRRGRSHNESRPDHCRRERNSHASRRRTRQEGGCGCDPCG